MCVIATTPGSLLDRVVALFEQGQTVGAIAQRLGLEEERVFTVGYLCGLLCQKASEPMVLKSLDELIAEMEAWAKHYHDWEDRSDKVVAKAMILDDAARGLWLVNRPVTPPEDVVP